MTNLINDISEQTNLLNSEKDSLLTNITNISAVSEQISATTQEIYASSEKLDTASFEVSNSAQKVSILSNELNKSFDQFKFEITS